MEQEAEELVLTTADSRHCHIPRAGALFHHSGKCRSQRLYTCPIPCSGSGHPPLLSTAGSLLHCSRLLAALFHHSGKCRCQRLYTCPIPCSGCGHLSLSTAGSLLQCISTAGSSSIRCRRRCTTLDVLMPRCSYSYHQSRFSNTRHLPAQKSRQTTSTSLC